MLAGYIYEPRAEAANAKAYPPPGELVDVGGYRLHIHCTGSPTVVINAGMGWSEAGPLPRDAAQFAKELHTLPQNANVPGPYVMVGHSLGGLGVHVFVHDYF